MNHSGGRVAPEASDTANPMVIGANGSAPKSQKTSLSDWAELHSSDHIVQFYQADDFLIESVAAFLATALHAGDAAVVCATACHRNALAERLQADGLDLAAARDSGRYIVRDAAETLSCFMVDAAPDPDLFNLTITSDLKLAAAAGRKVRAFGEMVALLVQEGNCAGAVAVEALWNDLQRHESFSIMCAYPMASMCGEAPVELFRHVCAGHTRVLPAESFLALPTADQRLRAVAELQQIAQQGEAAVVEARRSTLAAEEAVHDEREAARRVRDEFLSLAAHELRNPLAGLSLHAQLAARRLARDGQLDPSWGTQALQAITAQATKLTLLLDRLLDVARLEAGMIALESREVDLTALVAQAVADVRAWSQCETMHVVVPPSLHARLDPLRMEQALANLLHNAIKHTPIGGTIEVVLSQPRPDQIELVVQDSGPGIPVDARDAVFDRFGPTSTGDPAGGLGLGLYLSRQIVELHGGTLDLELPPDGGTRFVIRLPVVIGNQLSAIGSETTNPELTVSGRHPTLADS